MKVITDILRTFLKVMIMKAVPKLVILIHILQNCSGISGEVISFVLGTYESRKHLSQS